MLCVYSYCVAKCSDTLHGGSDNGLCEPCCFPTVIHAIQYILNVIVIGDMWPSLQ